jgi:hypothetical protein
MISSCRDEIVERVTDRLKSSTAPHYREMERGALEKRVGKLVDALVESAERGPATFVGYVQKLAAERIDEGYGLDEIQLALGIMEERAWQLVTERVPPPLQVRELAWITSTVGQAQDHLARVFLRHMERAELRLARLERRVQALAEGTVSPPLLEDTGTRN